MERVAWKLTLPYVKQIANGDLLYGSGNSKRASVSTQTVGMRRDGKEGQNGGNICIPNLYAEYIMRNTRLEETQAGIKIAGRNINNLRYADDTTLMAESDKELKSLLMKEESEKTGLKLNIQKTKNMASSPISSVHFSCSVMSDSLQPHESQHARPPCPSPIPRVHPNPCPLSR